MNESAVREGWRRIKSGMKSNARMSTWPQKHRRPERRGGGRRTTISTKAGEKRRIELYKGRIFWTANEGLPGEKVGFRDRT